MIPPSARRRTGWNAGRSCLPADDRLQPVEELEPLVGLALGDDLDRFLQRADLVARGTHARIVRDREARDQNADEVGRRTVERLAEAADDAGAEPGRFFLEVDGRAPAPRGRQVVEHEEPVRAGEADRPDVGGEARCADVVLQSVGDRREHPVVRLPAEELLEAEELADLEVDDAEVLDPLVHPLGRLEGMDRKIRDAVVDDALAAEVELVQRLRAARASSASASTGGNGTSMTSVRRLALILPPWCEIPRGATAPSGGALRRRRASRESPSRRAAWP